MVYYLQHKHEKYRGAMKKFLKVVVIIVGVAAVLAVAAAVIAVTLGYAYGGLKQPNSTVSLQTSICTKSDIDKYNKLVLVFPTSDAQQKQKAADFKVFGSEIQDKADYLKDPNCVFMAYGSAVQDRNQSDARTNYEALMSLSKEGAFPSNDILDIASLQSMKDRVESLSNSEEVQKSPLGSG